MQVEHLFQLDDRQHNRIQFLFIAISARSGKPTSWSLYGQKPGAKLGDTHDEPTEKGSCRGQFLVKDSGNDFARLIIRKSSFRNLNRGDHVDFTYTDPEADNRVVCRYVGFGRRKANNDFVLEQGSKAR